MNRNARLVAALIVAAALLTAVGCSKLKARDQLNQGVHDFKAAKLEQATEHFKNAVANDPDLKVAKLYLATAYAQQYIPGVDSKDNLRNAELAISEYNDVLRSEPNNPDGMLRIAYLYMMMKQYDKARDFYKKALALDANNPEAYYSVGYMDWQDVYKDIAEHKAKVNLKIEDQLKSKQICEEIKSKDGPVIDEGLQMLQSAMQKREDYDDAMVYMNLLYLRKADTECENPSAAAEDKKMSNNWADKAMAARKKKAEAAAKKNSGGITIEKSTAQPAEQKK